ncbi:MAG TPA: hypothetical protein PL105_05935 [Caldilineaceae bacterium]|nr:hypothetical protein [Caldilineaceae bacterium]
MEKTTVIATCRYTVDFTHEAKTWFRKMSNYDFWFAKEEGNVFLNEFGGTWRSKIQEVLDDEIRRFCVDLGMSHDELPFIGHVDSYRGSWIMEAAIVMFGAAASAYVMLQQVAPNGNIVAIADGLNNIGTRIEDRLDSVINKEVSEGLYGIVNQTIQDRERYSAPSSPLRSDPPMPSRLVRTNLVIDTRPMRGLTPALLKAHKVHLSVSVSRQSFTLENLGSEPMRNVQIGLFRSGRKRTYLSFSESYMAMCAIVTEGQSVAMRHEEFLDQSKNRFSLEDGSPAYVDCWVQDNSGIYLFQFFLERE